VFEEVKNPGLFHQSGNEIEFGFVVLHHDFVRLIHCGTDSYLITGPDGQSLRPPDCFSSIAAYFNGFVISNGFIVVVFNDGSPISLPMKENFF